MKTKRKPKKLTNVISIGSRLNPIPHAVVGWQTGTTPEGIPLVDFEGNEAGPLPALSIESARPAEPDQDPTTRREVLLAFNAGDPLRPIIIGRIAKPKNQSLLETTLTSLPMSAKVDGERVTVEGRDEIVLQCGEASITLRRNGKVIIRGTHLESYATGANRVKGASVQFN